MLRPTWHFVAPEDIRWMLELTGPRVKATIASYARHVSLDDAAFKRSRKSAEKRSPWRPAADAWRAACRRFSAPAFLPTGIRSVLLLMRAELDGLICSGPRAGKAFTYALLDDRVPGSPALTRDQALAELARRYFTSRGPATLQDFVWWSGLTTADARTGIEMAGSDLSRDVIDGSVCWLPSSMRVPCGGRPEPRTSCRCTTNTWLPTRIAAPSSIRATANEARTCSSVRRLS